MTRPGLEPLAQHPALEFKVAQPLLHTSVTCPLPTGPANPQSALLDAEALQHLERQKNGFSSSVAGGESPAATGNNVLRKLAATTAAAAALAMRLHAPSDQTKRHQRNSSTPMCVVICTGPKPLCRLFHSLDNKRSRPRETDHMAFMAPMMQNNQNSKPQVGCLDVATCLGGISQSVHSKPIVLCNKQSDHTCLAFLKLAIHSQALRMVCKCIEHLLELEPASKPCLRIQQPPSPNDEIGRRVFGLFVKLLLLLLPSCRKGMLFLFQPLPRISRRKHATPSLQDRS
mmetsp:Transcript_156506/g.502228  ORF Transcript_156506/g.502228 Transcript_156506/m.502228 type:complete len:286 (+) Transcript_156506:327-1184(+)|eukprot:CAMPEP_0203928708 /NCGR_PEP_ID=MMETSP0359-20131031/67866_1 /ASSEMBLY_ACC=CAM_ASM_000338 /TAXON_ID=268821 /ORGANISM="Scrippsiella Hangoei, Strain SHTV-5" /LENGTH=285 /DNA_ID=CAMNT_0050857659 /DNA_START=284 /DNA_END=1141 /DNA_ORIENTATION=-